ncbi:MAG: 4Fe-4S binding protein [Bacteroidales bacterium]|nr:4Fe-4S binding protein [Candidatus Latescibacterota bacterium]
MRIAFASGKGGAGKTTLAVNLAAVAAVRGIKTTYSDCDVEEPDGHIFLHPENLERTDVTVPVPVVDDDLCDGCGKCGEICNFNAIKVLAGRVVSFPELCHSCGGCTLVCPLGAISEIERKTGHIATGVSVVKSGKDAPGRLYYEVDECGGEKNTKETVGLERPGLAKLRFTMGTLDVGEPRSVPIIQDLLTMPDESNLFIIDSPPGTSCQMVESVRGADYVVLVAEATPFGLNDFKLAGEVVKMFGISCGVVLNRVMESEASATESSSRPAQDGIKEFCRENGFEVLAEIPAIRKIAEISSTGGLVAFEIPVMEQAIDAILDRLAEIIAG